MKFLCANRIAPDGTPRSAASHLGLYCLPMSHKGTPCLYELNHLNISFGGWGGTLNRFLTICMSLSPMIVIIIASMTRCRSSKFQTRLSHTCLSGT